jgi:hypothetical protein
MREKERCCSKNVAFRVMTEGIPMGREKGREGSGELL